MKSQTRWWQPIESHERQGRWNVIGPQTQIATFLSPLSPHCWPLIHCSCYLCREHQRGHRVTEGSAFEAAAVKNEAGRGNLSTLEGQAGAPVGARGVEAAAPYGTREAGRDGIDAASPLTASAAGRMEASRIGKREEVGRESGGVRRDFPLAAGSCFPVKPPPNAHPHNTASLPHPLWSLMLCRDAACTFPSFLSFPRSLCLCWRGRRWQNVDKSEGGMKRERKSFTVQWCRANPSHPLPPHFNFPTISWLIPLPSVWQPAPQPMPCTYKSMRSATANMFADLFGSISPWPPPLSSCIPGCPTLRGSSSSFTQPDWEHTTELYSEKRDILDWAKQHQHAAPPVHVII